MKTGIYMLSLTALFAGAAFANDIPPNFVGGNTDGSDRDSSITSNVSGSYNWIAGGNQNANAPTGNVNGDITLNLDNIDVSYGDGFICGGNLLNYLENYPQKRDTMGYVSGKVTINFNSGTLSASQGLYGGNAGGIPSQNNNYVGEVEINLNGGNVTNTKGVIGSGAAYSHVKGDVVINMNAGNISEITGVNGAAKVGGKVLINAKGGKLGNVYAGGQGGNSVVEGGTNIVLGGDVAVSGNVYGGGWYDDAGVNRSTIKNGTTITLTDNATVAGTINGGGVNGKTIIKGKKVLNLGTSSAAYNGTSTLKIADFDEINIAKGTTASVDKIEQNLTGAVADSRNFVNEGANFTVEGDITNTLTNATNSGSFVAGLTSTKGDLKSGGSAIVKGTVRTVINGADTKLNYVYGGNGGNQKGTDPNFRAIMESRVGAVDLTVNDGSIAMIVGNGAMLSDVDGNIDITVNGGTIGGIYGAGSSGLVGGDINITVNGGTFTGDPAGKYTVAIAAGGANNDNVFSSLESSTISGSTNVVIGGDAKLKGDVFGGGWGGYTNKKQGGLIKGNTNITIKGDAVIDGTIYGGGIAGMTEILGSKNLNIGTADEAYNGTTALKVSDMDTITVNKGTNARIESLTFNQTGAVVSGVTVKDGASLVVEGDITRNYNDITNSGSLVAGINGGDAVVNGTVRTVIDGANTKLVKFYGGNGGNQKTGEYTYNGKVYTDAIPKGTSTVGAVDITVNNGTIEGFIMGSGAMHSDVLGNVDIKINGGYVDDIYGGACGANIGGDINITVNGGKVGKIYAGSCGSGEGIRKDGIVGGSTNVVLGGDAVITGDVYGGGWSDGEKWRDTVKGSTNITLKDNATVGGTLYGGSLGGTGTIEGSKNLHIGTTDAAYTGNSALKVADFQNVNIVNGSADFASFTQADEGTLITISSKGNLSMSVNSADQFSKTSVSNDGVLTLKRGGLADSAEATVAGYTGNGKVNAYGGVFANGTFTAGKSQAFSGSAKVGSDLQNDIQSVSFADGNKKLNLDFDVSKMGDKKLEITSIAAVSDKGNIEGDFLGGFAVSVDNSASAEFGVVFSAYVGLVEDLEKLVAWHKSEGSDVWEKLETEITYEDGYASIIVDGFSSYAFSTIPEPSTVAVIFGIFALGFAAYRKRSK